MACFEELIDWQVQLFNLMNPPLAAAYSNYTCHTFICLVLLMHIFSPYPRSRFPWFFYGNVSFLKCWVGTNKSTLFV